MLDQVTIIKRPQLFTIFRTIFRTLYDQIQNMITFSIKHHGIRRAIALKFFTGGSAGLMHEQVWHHPWYWKFFSWKIKFYQILLALWRYFATSSHFFCSFRLCSRFWPNSIIYWCSISILHRFLRPIIIKYIPKLQMSACAQTPTVLLSPLRSLTNLSESTPNFIMNIPCRGIEMTFCWWWVEMVILFLEMPYLFISNKSAFQ